MSRRRHVRLALFLVGTSLVLLTPHGPSVAAPAQFWLSLSSANPYVFSLTRPAGSAPGVPDLAMNPGQTANVYLWAKPQTFDAGQFVELAPGGPYSVMAGGEYHPTSNPFRQLVGISLDLVAEGAAQVASVLIENPRADSQPFSDPDARFQTLIDSANPQTIGGDPEITYPNPVDNGLEGILASRPVAPVREPGAAASTVAPDTVGIGGSCTPLDGCFVGTNGPAWRLGEVRVTSASDLADGEIWLQVGISGMGHVGEIVDNDLSGSNAFFQYVSLAAFGGAGEPAYNTQDPSHRQASLPGDSPDLRLTVVSPLTGDYNADGVVDAADYTLYRDLQGTDRYLPNREFDTEACQSGSPIGNCDYLEWQAGYGSRTEPTSSSIPEPMPLGLVAIAVVLAVTASFQRNSRLLAIVLVPFLASPLIAQDFQLNDHYWTGGGSGSGAGGSPWGGLNNWLRYNGSDFVTPNSDSLLESATRIFFDEARFGIPSNKRVLNLNGNRTNTRLLTFRNTNGSLQIDPGNEPNSILGIRDQGIDVLEGSGQIRINSIVRIQDPQSWRNWGNNRLIVNGPVYLNHDLTINGPSNTELNGVIQQGPTSTSAGRLIKRGDGQLTLSGTNTFSTGVDILNGEVNIMNAGAMGSGSVTLGGGSLRVAVPATLSNPFDIGAAPEQFLRVGTNNVTLSGAIGGTGWWTKEGTGQLTLSGDNGFSGFLTIGEGVVRLTNDNSLNSGAIFSEGTTLWVADSGTFDAELHSSSLNAGRFYKSEAGRLTLTKTTKENAFGNDFTGLFEIESGELAATPSQFNNNDIYTNSSGAGAVFLGAGEYGGLVAGSGKLVKEQSGTLAITSNQSYGATVISQGVLQVGVGGSSGTLGSGGTSIASGANLTFNRSNSYSYAGAISGSGSVTKTGAGTLTLTGNNSYGSTVVSQGTLQVGAGGSTGTLGTGGTSIAGGANLTVNRSGSYTYNGLISGSGSLTKTGSGTLALNGTTTYAGLTTISAGRLELGASSSSSAFAVNGDLAIAASNVISDTAQISIGSGGRFIMNDRTETIGSLEGAAGATTIITNGVLTVGGNGLTKSYSGIIAGDGGSLVKQGNETLNLFGANSYTGSTEVRSGTLRLGAAGVIANQSEVIVLPQGTLDLNDFNETIGALTGAGLVDLGEGTLTVGDLNSDVSFSGNIVGGPNGKFTKRGIGTLTMLGNTAFEGNSGVSLGTLALTGSSQSRTHVLTGGELLLNAANRIHDEARVSLGTNGRFTLAGHNETIGSLEGLGTVDLGEGALTVGGNGRTSNFSGSIDGIGGTLIKSGPETMVLSGLSTYDGLTTVIEGRLDFLDRNPPGQSDIGTGARLVLSGDNRTSGAQRIYPFDISGDGILRKEGSSTLSLTGTNTHAGGTEIAGGILSADLDSLRGGVVLSNDAELWLTVTTNKSGEYSGNITGAGVLRKTPGGGGVLTLTGANSYSGGTFVEGGVLKGTSASLVGSIDVAEGTSVVFDQQESGSFSSAITGAGSLTKSGAGSLTLSGSTSHSGGTAVLGGKLVVNTSSLQGSVVNDSEVTISQSNDGTYPGVMTGTGVLRKIKLGSVSLNGESSYSGGTFIEAGTLRVNGSIHGPVVVSAGATLGGNGSIGEDGTTSGNVSGPGRVAPGNSPGILTINGDFTQEAGSVLDIEVEGTATAGVDYDLVRVGGQATLRGTYNFALPTSGYSPMLGDAITFIETFGPTGEILAVPPGSEPAVLVSGLNDPNLAARVVSTVGIGGMVDLEFVPSSSVALDSPSQDVDWFDGTAWTGDSVPIGENNVGIGSPFVQIGVSQTVTIDGSNARVNRLTISDIAESKVVSIASGFGLTAETGDISIGQNAAIELDSAQLTLAASRRVAITDTGMLVGSGAVNGNVEVGLSASDSAMLSPGVGVTPGTISVSGNYAQGAGGILEIDITGTGGGANNDFVNVTGALTLDDAMTPGVDGGKLRIDLSDVADPMSIIGQEYVIAEAASIQGEFSDIELVGAGNVYFRVEYGDSASAAASDGQVGELVESRQLLKGTAARKGDVVGSGSVIDKDDAAVLSAVLIGGNRLLSVEGIGVFDESWLSGAFNFVRSPFETTSDPLIDFNDVPYFAAAMADSQGISYAQAMSSFQQVYLEVYYASVPEPTCSLLCLMGLGTLAGAIRRSRV